MSVISLKYCGRKEATEINIYSFLFVKNIYQLKKTNDYVKTILFPTNPNGVFISVILLAVRIVFGILMMNHGIDKWANYQELSTVFPDPLGIGSPLSLGLAIFGELACSMAFIIGFLYRLAMIPMIFTMCVAFFIVHGNDPFAVKELAFVYLVVFVLMYIIGPGKFAVDRWISQSLSRK